MRGLVKGFIDFELKRQIKYITIKPGERYLLKENINSFLHINEQQVYFPGELVLNKFEIKVLSYLEIINSNNQLYLFIRPVTRYEFTNETSKKKLKPNPFTDI